MFRTNGEEPSAAQRNWQKPLLWDNSNVILGFMQGDCAAKKVMP